MGDKRAASRISRAITILGATGSVGKSTLDVITANPGITVFAITANRNVKDMITLCAQFNPQYAVMADVSAALALKQELSRRNSKTAVLDGEEGLVFVAEHPNADTVMAAIVGAAGLLPSLAAAKAGKKVLLANKEALVMAGDLFMEQVRTSNACLLPIDSEHNAIFQCLPQYVQESITGQRPNSSPTKLISKVILTASGGPFRELSAQQLEAVTPQQACKHPNWDMGDKISVDSASMMNKGLEFIEACLLFELQPSQLEVLVHPQSIVHSMIEYIDGSVIAELASPDMKVPIAYGLAWPERIRSGASMLDLTKEDNLEFLLADLEQFPCLALGIQAAEQGGTTPAVLNAANEVAVEAFLGNKIAFTQIPSINKAVMDKIPCEAALTTDIILAADKRAREMANSLINKEK